MKKNPNKARRVASAATGGWGIKSATAKSRVVRTQREDIGIFVKGFYEMHGKVMSRLAHE